jgi:histidine triad (HIT) family protein
MERHSGDPKSSVNAVEKKGGGGGKFTAGKPGDEMGDIVMDPKDPNYDPEEEAAHYTKSENTFFDKVVRGEVEIASVYEDSQVLAIEEQHSPAAPVHILLFPKKRIQKLRHASSDDQELLGHLMVAAAKVARQQNIQDYRLVINDGSQAGQTVNYLVLNILAGRPLSWPPC